MIEWRELARSTPHFCVNVMSEAHLGRPFPYTCLPRCADCSPFSKHFLRPPPAGQRSWEHSGKYSLILERDRRQQWGLWQVEGALKAERKVFGWSRETKLCLEGWAGVGQMMKGRGAGGDYTEQNSMGNHSNMRKQSFRTPRVKHVWRTTRCDPGEDTGILPVCSDLNCELWEACMTGLEQKSNPAV